MLHLVLAVLLLAESSTNVDSSPLPGAETELMSENNAVVEGDVLLRRERNAVENIWPTLEIPYRISPELAGQTDDILASMAMLSKPTCVSFHEQTSETDYLLFNFSKGCGSYVGFIGGEQPVLIGPACSVGMIAHEVLHALGLYHEHTRADRRKYIAILPDNIIKGTEGNFDVENGRTFNLSYDLSSIMHYGRGVFSANGLPTILPKKSVKDMGQRVKLTNTDIKKVRLLYSCDVHE
ncbi:zinc metalloproteinase nas-4-like [Etheostoma cragini]|uniref:zinc metalloproteinase nas-4-like n=1 Tax=Etheostoma cragini TaxID=417921 RepID=UPI00155E267A|nr:zinc metalloproteinase nas-4-like [Etheostoma cragini]